MLYGNTVSQIAREPIHEEPNQQELKKESWLFSLRTVVPPSPSQDECFVMLDSGAELHVCPKEWLRNYAKNNENPEKDLRLADGSPMAAHGRRTVRLELLDTNGFQCDSTFVACDVATPIWSVGQLARDRTPVPLRRCRALSAMGELRSRCTGEATSITCA